MTARTLVHRFASRLLPASFAACAVWTVCVIAPASALAIDTAHREQAEALADKAAAWLKSQQDESGGWNVPPKDSEDPTTAHPHYPGITGLVLTGLVLDPDQKHDELVITSGAKYLLNWQQPDGGIYDRVLPSYNTSLSLSALARIRQPWAQDAVKPAVRFLKSLQWSEASDPSIGGDEASKPVAKEHPFYGGVGYGRHGRPDGSNLNFFMQAMQDAGVPSDDPAIKRAMVFLQRLQMLDEANDMPYADGSRQGGFVYATTPDGESVDSKPGQSHAGSMEETLDDGTKVSKLRAYGTMTYAGFKSYLYADLAKDDVRVTSALNWIRDHYTLTENPGMDTAGLYYYYVAFARALGAWGQPRLDVRFEGKVANRDWANDMIDELAKLQNDDGSFKSVNKRWMEDNPVLITAYSLIALRTAINESELVSAPAATKADPASSNKQSQ